MTMRQFDLQDYLNHFLDANLFALDAVELEATLATIEREVKSIHTFLLALVDTALWQSWLVQSSPYKKMILTLGSEIDRMASTLTEPAYHSRRHVIDVCLMLSYLLKHEQSWSHDALKASPWSTSVDEKGLLLLAAVAHDLGHPGLINSVPYELEVQSLTLLKDFLPAAGFHLQDINLVLGAMEPWILATDHAQYSTLIDRLSIKPPSHTDCLAMLLVESDLASSVLPNRGVELANRLSDEWAKPYPEKSIALRNQLGYLSFLTSLQFISPHSESATLPLILNNSLLQLRSHPS